MSEATKSGAPLATSSRGSSSDYSPPPKGNPSFSFSTRPATTGRARAQSGLRTERGKPPSPTTGMIPCTSSRLNKLHSTATRHRPAVFGTRNEHDAPGRRRCRSALDRSIPTSRARNERERNWDIAFCYGLAELRRNRGGSECEEVPNGKIVVRTLKQVGRDRGIAQDAEPWSRYLPRVDQTEQLRASLARFHEFIRCTNQIELLIRDSEIFSYVVVSQDRSQEGVEKLLIREVERNRPPLHLFKIEGGLFDFLQREIESNKRTAG